MTEEMNTATEQGVNYTDNHNHGHSTIAVAEVSEPAADTTASDWYISEGVKGTGEMPKGFNHKTFKTVEANLEAYSQLQKKLSEKGGAAPDNGNYELALSEDYKDITFKDDDKLMSGWKELAAKNKFSNDQFNAGIEMWLGYLNGYSAEKQEAFQGVIKELGVDGEQKLTDLGNWFDNSFGDIESFDTFKAKMTDAQDINLLMKMRDAMNGSNVIMSGESSKPKDRSYFLGAMSRDKGYGVNQHYTKKITSEFNEYMKSKS